MRLVYSVVMSVLVLSSCGNPARDEDPVTTGAGGNAAAVGPAVTGNPDLKGYVGKYPFDAVNGVTFFNHPMVVSAVTASVTDGTIRATVLAASGPSAPIELDGNAVRAWACEAHNCGDHQWTISVDPSSGEARVCYYDADSLPDSARWFLPAGKMEQRAGNCQ